MEKEIFESSEFERSVSEIIIYIDTWIKSGKDEVMSNRTQQYPVQAPVSPVQSQLPKLDISFFQVIPFRSKRSGNFSIA